MNKTILIFLISIVAYQAVSSSNSFRPTQNRQLAVPLFVAPLVGLIGTAAGTVIRDQKLHLKNSIGTTLVIENDTDDEFTIKVSDVDNHDWDGDSRPDHEGTGFQNAVLEPRQSIEKHQEINAKSSSAMSTMTFQVGEEERFSFRVDQWNSVMDQEEEYDLDNDYYVRHVGVDNENKLIITIMKK